MTADWTDAHRREAFVRLCELAIEERPLRSGVASAILLLVEEGATDAENSLRKALASLRCFDRARIDREVAIVRERAERPAQDDATATALPLSPEELAAIRRLVEEDRAELPDWAHEDITRLLATLDARDAELEQARKDAYEISHRLTEKLRALTDERDFLKRREQSIIEATEPADGGQYRADIAGAIRRLRRERDELAARVAEYEAEPKRREALWRTLRDRGGG